MDEYLTASSGDMDLFQPPLFHPSPSALQSREEAIIFNSFIDLDGKDDGSSDDKEEQDDDDSKGSCGFEIVLPMTVDGITSGDSSLSVKSMESDTAIGMRTSERLDTELVTDRTIIDSDPAAVSSDGMKSFRRSRTVSSQPASCSPQKDQRRVHGSLAHTESMHNDSLIRQTLPKPSATRSPAAKLPGANTATTPKSSPERVSRLPNYNNDLISQSTEKKTLNASPVISKVTTSSGEGGRRRSARISKEYTPKFPPSDVFQPIAKRLKGEEKSQSRTITDEGEADIDVESLSDVENQGISKPSSPEAKRNEQNRKETNRKPSITATTARRSARNSSISSIGSIDSSRGGLAHETFASARVAHRRDSLPSISININGSDFENSNHRLGASTFGLSRTRVSRILSGERTLQQRAKPSASIFNPIPLPGTLRRKSVMSHIFDREWRLHSVSPLSTFIHSPSFSDSCTKALRNRIVDKVGITSLRSPNENPLFLDLVDRPTRLDTPRPIQPNNITVSFEELGSRPLALTSVTDDNGSTGQVKRKRDFVVAEAEAAAAASAAHIDRTSGAFALKIEVSVSWEWEGDREGYMKNEVETCTFILVSAGSGRRFVPETRKLYLPLGLFRGSDRLGNICFEFLHDRFSSVVSPLSLDPMHDIPKLFNAWLIGRGPHQQRRIIAPSVRIHAFSPNQFPASNASDSSATLQLESFDDDDALGTDRRIVVVNDTDAFAMAYERFFKPLTLRTHLMRAPSALSSTVDQGKATSISSIPVPEGAERVPPKFSVQPRMSRLRTNVGVFSKEGVVRFFGNSKTMIASHVALAQLCQIALSRQSQPLLTIKKS